MVLEGSTVDVIQSQTVLYHIYTDDTLLYMSIKPGSMSLSNLLTCVNYIKSLMGDTFIINNTTTSSTTIYNTLK